MNYVSVTTQKHQRLYTIPSVYPVAKVKAVKAVKAVEVNRNQVAEETNDHNDFMKRRNQKLCILVGYLLNICYMLGTSVFRILNDT